MHNINTVIFDLGRVLVNIDTNGEKFGRLMQAVGIPASEAFDKFWYLSEVRQHMTGELDSREFYQHAVDRFNLSFSYDDFAEGWCDLFSPIEGMEQLFSDIAARYTVGILSDTDPLHWNRIIAMLPWLSTIATPTLSYHVGYLKPHPKMFAAAAANCCRAKEECLFIDDRIENVDGARYSGMPALLFTTPEKLRRDLTGLQVL